MLHNSALHKCTIDIDINIDISILVIYKLHPYTFDNSQPGGSYLGVSRLIFFTYKNVYISYTECKIVLTAKTLLSHLPYSFWR